MDPVDTQLNFPTKGPFLKGALLRSPGMMLTHKSAGLLQGGRKGAARGAYEPLSWSRVSPGGERWDAPATARRTDGLLQGTRGWVSELSKKPVSAYLYPGVFNVPLPFLIMIALDKITPHSEMNCHLQAHEECQFGISDRGTSFKKKRLQEYDL